MVEVSRRSLVVAAEDQTSCRLADEVVVLGLQAGVYYGLNPLAARVWELIREPRTVNEILGILLEEYEVDADRCEQDLVSLFRELVARDLIRIADDASS